MFPSAFSYINKTAPSPSQNGCRQRNGRTLSGGQKLCSSRIPQWQHGTSLLQQDAWSYRGDSSAAHLSLPQSSCRKLDAREQTSMFISQEAASCLYRAGSVVFASKIHTNLFFPARVQAFASPPAGREPRRKSPPLPTSPHPTLGCFSVSPSSILVLFCEGVKIRVPGIGAKIQQHLWKRQKKIFTPP